MRGPLPLSDDDFREVRAKVLAAIDRPRRLPIWRMAFAAAVVVALVVLFLPARRPSPAAPRHPLPLTQERGAAVVPVVAQVQPPPRKGRVRVAHHRKAIPKTPVAVARMEIQTADPDVRIIWISTN